jgi:hypothetical protein
MPHNDVRPAVLTELAVMAVRRIFPGAVSWEEPKLPTNLR